MRKSEEKGIGKILQRASCYKKEGIIKKKRVPKTGHNPNPYSKAYNFLCRYEGGCPYKRTEDDEDYCIANTFTKILMERQRGF